MASTVIGWDWKSGPDFDELQKALEPFGVYVYSSVVFEGTDGYAYVFSDKELTEEEIEKIETEEYDL